MRRVRVVIALVCFVVWAVSASYMAYLQWWVHPEYTKPMLFWAYWPIVVVLFVALTASVLLFESLSPSRKGRV